MHKYSTVIVGILLISSLLSIIGYPLQGLVVGTTLGIILGIVCGFVISESANKLEDYDK